MANHEAVRDTLDKSLQDFFRDFDFSVGVYGEMVATRALDGGEQGHGRRGYDIRVGEHMRVEVRSLLAYTKSGRAEVVNCSAEKFDGDQAMTHLLVVLIWPEDSAEVVPNQLCDWLPVELRQLLRNGDVLWAWMLTAVEARAALHKNRGKHISVEKLYQLYGAGHPEWTARLQAAAECPLRSGE